MNFEIIDNVFQVAVFFAAALGDMVYWLIEAGIINVSA